MHERIRQQLVDLNRTFYERFSGAFDETRTGAWPGWHRLIGVSPGGAADETATGTATRSANGAKTETADDPATETADDPATETADDPATETADGAKTGPTDDAATETADNAATETADNAATATADGAKTATAVDAATETAGASSGGSGVARSGRLITGRVLDLGCGNGRFARFLAGIGADVEYEGWDDNDALLARARAKDGTGTYRRVDLLQPVWPPAAADLVTAFGVLHHVPSFEGRQRFLRQALGCVAAGGRLAVTFWQFAPDGGPRVATAPWSTASIDPDAVDPGDFLVRWKRGGQGLRYCHHAGPDEVDRLLDGLGGEVHDRFFSDGASGDLNLYVVIKPS